MEGGKGAIDLDSSQDVPMSLAGIERVQAARAAPRAAPSASWVDTGAGVWSPAEGGGPSADPAASVPPPPPSPPDESNEMRVDGGNSERHMGARVRLYCPVSSCAAADCRLSQGWADLRTLSNHMEAHASGRLVGDVPRDWMAANGLGQCSICSRLLAARYGGTCPRCRPGLADGGPSGASECRDVPLDRPSLRLSSTSLTR